MDEVCVPICCNVGGLWELCGMYSDNVIAIFICDGTETTYKVGDHVYFCFFRVLY